MTCSHDSRAESFEALPWTALERVTLHGVRVLTCEACGETTREIEQPTSAAVAIAQALIWKPGKLTPAEFKHLRRRVHRRAVAFAHIFGVSPESVSRWEHGKQAISSLADRGVRLAAALAMDGHLDVGVLGEIDDADDAPLELDLERTHDGWRVVTSSEEAAA